MSKLRARLIYYLCTVIPKQNTTLKLFMNEGMKHFSAFSAKEIYDKITPRWFHFIALLQTIITYVGEKLHIWFINWRSVYTLNVIYCHFIVFLYRLVSDYSLFIWHRFSKLLRKVCIASKLFWCNSFRNWRTPGTTHLIFS